MSEYRVVWEPMLEEFEKRYPYIAKSIRSWYPYSRNEIVIITNDGNIIYDSMIKTIRSYNFEDEDAASEEEWKKEYSKRLCERMRRFGMLRWQLSDKTGISEVMLSRYMNGQAIPSTYNNRKIARALECSVSYLSEF